jgi:F-type H+-transporting ATPase subunit beta
MPETKGRVVQILGGVVDVEFPAELLPGIYEALMVDRPGQPPVQRFKSISSNWVRCVYGNYRWLTARLICSCYRHSVRFRWSMTLGRIFMYWKPVDDVGLFPTQVYYPIHRSA